MAQVERSTSTGGKRYLTSKAVVYDSVTARNIQLGGKNNGNGQLKLYDDTDTLFVNMDKEGIKLSNGAEIIGGSGVLTNFQYYSVNVGFAVPNAYTVFDYFFLGYNSDFSAANWGSFIELNAYIPSNFTITEAKIVFTHTPTNWVESGVYDVWGYCRNVKAYKVTNTSDIVVSSAYASTPNVSGGYTLTEISNAFGASGYTPSTPSASSHITEITTSIDIKSSLIAGNNKIVVKSGDAVPAYNATFATNAANLGIKTGYAKAIINIIGYLQ